MNQITKYIKWHRFPGTRSHDPSLVCKLNKYYIYTFIYFLKIIYVFRDHTHIHTHLITMFSQDEVPKKNVGASVYTLSMVRNQTGQLAAPQIPEFAHYVSCKITALQVVCRDYKGLGEDWMKKDSFVYQETLRGVSDLTKITFY